MDHFYLKSFRNTILQFLSIFNDITVAKYNKQGVATKIFTVPVKMASKEKSYMWAMDRKNEKALPMIAVNLSSISYAQDRVEAKGREIYFDVNYLDGTYRFYNTPTPYNIEFAVTVIANYVVEMDQILERILSFFNPYVYIRIKVSDYSDETWQLKVLFDGASPDHSPELEESEYRFLSWTLNFTIQGFMFRPATDSDAVSGGLIKSVVRRYWGDHDVMMDNLSSEDNIPSASTGWTRTAITSGLGYDGDGELLYSYEIFDKED